MPIATPEPYYKEAKRSNSILPPFKSLLVRKLNGQVYGKLMLPILLPI
jgi:hypothetical protein